MQGVRGGMRLMVWLVLLLAVTDGRFKWEKPEPKEPVVVTQSDLVSMNKFRSMCSFYSGQVEAYMKATLGKHTKHRSYGPKHAPCLGQIKKMFHCIAACDPFNSTKWNEKAIYEACPGGWGYGATPFHVLFHLAAFQNRHKYNYGMQVPVGKSSLKHKIEILEHRLENSEQLLAQGKQKHDTQLIEDSNVDIKYLSEQLHSAKADLASYKPGKEKGMADADTPVNEKKDDKDDHDNDHPAEEDGIRDLADVDSPLLDAYKARFESLLNTFYIFGTLLGTIADGLTKPLPQMDMGERAIYDLLNSAIVGAVPSLTPASTNASSTATPHSTSTNASSQSAQGATSSARVLSANNLIQHGGETSNLIQQGLDALTSRVDSKTAALDSKADALQHEADRAEGLAPPVDEGPQNSREPVGLNTTLSVLPESVRPWLYNQCRSGGLCEFEKIILYVILIVFLGRVYLVYNIGESLYGSYALRSYTFEDMTDVGNTFGRPDFQGLIPLWWLLIMLLLRVPLTTLEIAHDFKEIAKDSNYIITFGIPFLVQIAFGMLQYLSYYDSVLHRIWTGAMPFGTGKEWQASESVKTEFARYASLHEGFLEKEPLWLQTDFVQAILSSGMYAHRKECTDEVLADISWDLVMSPFMAPKLQTLIIHSTFLMLTCEAQKSAWMEYVMHMVTKMGEIGHKLVSTFAQINTQIQSQQRDLQMYRIGAGGAAGGAARVAAAGNGTRQDNATGSGASLLLQEQQSMRVDEVAVLRKSLAKDEAVIADLQSRLTEVDELKQQVAGLLHASSMTTTMTGSPKEQAHHTPGDDAAQIPMQPTNGARDAVVPANDEHGVSATSADYLPL